MRRILVGVLIVTAALGGATLWSGEAASPEIADDPTLVAEKQGHLEEVVATLRERERPELEAERRARRARALDELERYAEEGVFIHNTDFPDESTPYFRDRLGRLCALGHLIDATWRTDLLEVLVQEANNAWISQLTGNADLDAWLDHHGLTKEEVAYIQGPGFVTDTPIVPGTGTPNIPGRRAGGTTAPRRAGAPTVRGPGRGASRLSVWEGWWSNSWRRFGAVRAGRSLERKHRRYERVTAPRRPERARVLDEVAPVLEALASGKDDVASTAVVALARAVGRLDPERAFEVASAAQRRLKADGRPFAVLALAWIPSEASRERLQAIVSDRADGRKALALSRSVPDRIRAFAAFGLGVHGGAEHVEVLFRELESGTKSSPDYRAALVVSLGLAGERGVVPSRITRRLTRMMSHDGLADAARAAIPGALVLAGEHEGRDAVREIVRTFDGPTVLRRAAAAALGRFPGEDQQTTTTLEKASRRDPDLLARQQAILSLGERGLSGSYNSEERKRVSKFLLDGVTQRFRQASDRATFCVAAALMARGHETMAPKLVRALEAIFEGSSALEDQEAATLALGLMNVSPALNKAATLEGEAKNATLRARAVEARGLYADPRGLERWMSYLQEDKSDDVRRAAARSLARLEEPSLLPFLLDELESVSSTSARGVLAEVLGEIGDQNLMEALLALVQRDAVANPVRMRATASLGRLCEPEDRTWFHRATDHLEATGLTPSLAFLQRLF